MTVATSARARALIVDDEPLARRRLAAMLADEKEVEVIGAADGGAAAVERIVTDKPDIVFLDVQMPGLDGFGVLRCTAGAHQSVVVFITAHDAHAIRAFELHAADYLLKPVSTARLHEAVRRAVERVRQTSRRDGGRAIGGVLASVPETAAAVARIPVRLAHGTDFVNVAQITRVEADGGHARLHVGATVISVRETMAELEARLASFRFRRVHRSLIVNADAVRTIKSIAKGDYHLLLSDGSSVRSGRRYRKTIQDMLRRVND